MLVSLRQHKWGVGGDSPPCLSIDTRLIISHHSLSKTLLSISPNPPIPTFFAFWFFLAYLIGKSKKPLVFYNIASCLSEEKKQTLQGVCYANKPPPSPPFSHRPAPPMAWATLGVSKRGLYRPTLHLIALAPQSPPAPLWVEFKRENPFCSKIRVGFNPRVIQS